MPTTIRGLRTSREKIAKVLLLIAIVMAALFAVSVYILDRFALTYK